LPVASQAAFHEGFFGFTQRRVLQFERAPDDHLTLLHREHGQLLQYFGKTHVGKLVHHPPDFNPDSMPDSEAIGIQRKAAKAQRRKTRVRLGNGGQENKNTFP